MPRIASCALLQACVFAMWLVAADMQARATDPSFDFRSTLQAATAVLEWKHFTRRPLDDKLAAEWLAAFVADLDPRRMYFLQTDIAEFQPFGQLLDDHAKTGDFQFSELVRSRYRDRVAAATAHAIALVGSKHDFAIDESLPLRFAGFAKSPNELRERWRLRIKGELLVERAHGGPIGDIRSHLRGRYERIAKQAREMSDERLCQWYLDALAKCYDARSAYFSPTFCALWEGGFLRNYSLGLTLQYAAGRYRIVGIESGIPNPEAKSVLGWELMAIQRPNGDIVDFVELPPEDAFRTIRLSSGQLQSDSRVRFELLHPVTLQRKSMDWNRAAD